MKKLLIFILVIGGGMLFPITKANALSCLESDLSVDFNNAEVVFVGTVTSIRINELNPFANEFERAPDTAFFRVDTMYKGPYMTEIPMQSGGIFNSTFSDGQQWLLFASKNPQTDIYETSPCSGNAYLNYPGNDGQNYTILNNVATLSAQVQLPYTSLSTFSPIQFRVAVLVVVCILASGFLLKKKPLI